MAKPGIKVKKIGRNDPCHCGSGRKYKDCHLPIEEAWRSEQMSLRQAQDTLLPKIVEAAQADPAQLPAAFARFWQERYTLEQMADLDDLEDRGAERFLIWYAFDLRDEHGRTLVERLCDAARADTFALEPYESVLLDIWREARLQPYVVESIDKRSGFVARDLFSEQRFVVSDQAATKRLQPGEVIVGHLVPVDTAVGADAPTYYLAGAAAQLTADTAETLLTYAEMHLADLRRTLPEAGWRELIVERSDIFNHFVLALPHEAPEPGVFDQLINEGMVTLKLTQASMAALLGRDEPAQPEAGADDGDTQAKPVDDPAE
jgi:hypothetical protein